MIVVSDIFISYAREDRETAERLAHALTNQGWSVWWDRDIPPGQSFDQVIEQQIDAARCMVVLWSRTSAPSDWTKVEAEEGERRGVLVPALIEDVRIPLAFRRIQAADLVDWTGDEQAEGFAALVAAVRSKLTASDGDGSRRPGDRASRQAEKGPGAAVEQRVGPSMERTPVVGVGTAVKTATDGHARPEVLTQSARLMPEQGAPAGTLSPGRNQLTWFAAFALVVVIGGMFWLAAPKQGPAFQPPPTMPPTAPANGPPTGPAVGVPAPTPPPPQPPPATSTPQAPTGDIRDFRLHNHTSWDIGFVYVTTVDSSDWGNDVLGGQILYSGQDVDIISSGQVGTCYYDIRVEGFGGEYGEMDSVDLCTTSDVEFYDQALPVY